MVQALVWLLKGQLLLLLSCIAQALAKYMMVCAVQLLQFAGRPWIAATLEVCTQIRREERYPETRKSI